MHLPNLTCDTSLPPSLRNQNPPLPINTPSPYVPMNKATQAFYYFFLFPPPMASSSNAVRKRRGKEIAHEDDDFDAEFYANARIDPDSEDDPRFHTFVRGVMVNFSMDRIKTVMKFEGPLNTKMSYRTRMIKGNQELDTMIRDLCVEGSVWSLGARNNPLYLKRSDLNPIARGWHEFIIHNIMPTTNQSEVTLNRAVLIHCIMSSQEVRVEKIIVDAMINIISKLHATKLPLAFPNIIARLCEEMEVSYLASGPVEAVPKARPITTAVMENLRYLPVQPYFHQEQPANAAKMPQGYGWGQLQEDMANLNKNQTEFYHNIPGPRSCLRSSPPRLGDKAKRYVGGTIAIPPGCEKLPSTAEGTISIVSRRAREDA
ncbi:hypothetical protein PIB30_089202 [Stylosanthes scabra]|uniref:Putative plant transposon protein domain-containing protein n=1 Tax=Stylosanthes scabra TaxID=79078 RepID=A0ABU6SV26_9FABA|nr:hypothetical protein [Stylosanthes scabra]